MVETVHMLLFLVMVVFILEVLLFLALGKKTEKDWIQAEKDCKNPQKVVENYNRLKESGINASIITHAYSLHVHAIPCNPQNS